MATDAVDTTVDSCIDFDVEYQDQDGNPEDLTDDTFAVHSMLPASVAADVVITKTDPVNGIIHVHIPEAGAEKLRPGRTNWLRIERTFLDGCTKNSPRIWIEVE